MSKRLLPFLAGMLLLPCLAGPITDTGHTKFSGVYRLYGGGLADPLVPSAKDTKIMFALQGEVAREMFEAMAPDVQDACTAGSGTRVRIRDNENLVCSRSKQGHYSCNFGFDLKTGKSTGGVVC